MCPAPRHRHELPVLALLLVLVMAMAACGGDSSAAAQVTAIARGTPLATEPPAPKQPGTPVTSCPLPTPQPTISAPSLPTQGYSDVNVDNSVAVMPADQPLYEYVILAGNRKANPRQGLLIVQRLVRDRCADAKPNDGTVWTYYDTPFQQGRVQLTGVVGDTVTFTTADDGGRVHRFGFVTGQFL